MRKVVLIFPDIISLSEFILSFKVSKALVESTDKKLTAIMTTKNLHIACSIYGAKIKESISITAF